MDQIIQKNYDDLIVHIIPGESTKKQIRQVQINLNPISQRYAVGCIAMRAFNILQMNDYEVWKTSGFL